MEPVVFAAVLFAALLHASWNVVLKLGTDRFSAVLLLALVQAAIALPLLPFVPQPAPEGWAWIAGAAVLHSGYKLFLVRAYAHGELGQVYPLARGTAPLIVALVSVALLGERLAGAELAAILLISAGVLTMALKGGGPLGRMSPHGLAYALGTAGFTAAYTLFDGVGARVAGTPSGFILWMVIGDALVMVAAGLLRRGRGLARGLRPALVPGIAAGALSLASYWIAVWAFTRAPIALVAALRETSILFAILIATVVLGERAGCGRIAAAGLIVAGVALMRL